MTAAGRVSISDLPRGHVFASTQFSLDDDAVRRYLAATGDRGAYGDRVPPLAAVALGLAALQQQLSLPAGALHTGQEVQQHTPVRCGASLSLRGSVAQRSERQGFVISVIEFEIGVDASVAISARTTIMAPAASS